jgi:hypothetical protein
MALPVDPGNAEQRANPVPAEVNATLSDQEKHRRRDAKIGGT